MMQASRELRRAVAKSNRRSGRKTQHHKTPRQILQDTGVGVFTRFVPLTEDQKTRLGLALQGRINNVMDGSPKREDWSYLLSALIEGYLTVRCIADDRIRNEWMRDVKAAARLLDAAATHFQRSGIVTQANISAVAGVLTDLEALKYDGSVNRADNVAILNYANENFKAVVLELFGGMPQCGLLEE